MPDRRRFTRSSPRRKQLASAPGTSTSSWCIRKWPGRWSTSNCSRSTATRLTPASW
jgi:hypothetical protein